jgi:ribosomal protein S18 acetylase RimI-like enzyme
MISIRPATSADRESIWSVIAPVIRGGETYALPPDMPRDDALSYWMGADRDTFVAQSDGEIVGTYYLRANQMGGGRHVANCGYITAPHHTGRGIARTMCEHSLARARAQGFKAMQFNFVVSSNERAVRLWQSLGFAIAGRLPGAFERPCGSFADALVMVRAL